MTNDNPLFTIQHETWYTAAQRTFFGVESISFPLFADSGTEARKIRLLIAAFEDPAKRTRVVVGRDGCNIYVSGQKVHSFDPANETVVEDSKGLKILSKIGEKLICEFFR